VAVRSSASQEDQQTAASGSNRAPAIAGKLLSSARCLAEFRSIARGQEGGPRELQAGQPHLHPGKGDGAAYPGGHQQASGGKEGYQEESAWIHQGEIMPDQSDSFL